MEGRRGITDAQLRDKYIPGWNGLFITEQQKYDVAKYTHRSSVVYATDVAEQQNRRGYSPDILSGSAEDEHRLDAQAVARIVRGYDFRGHRGIGLLFIVESMSKGKEQASAWVTFADMDSRKVLETRRITGKAGGFGFRNYWAKAFFNILKDVRDMR